MNVDQILKTVENRSEEFGLEIINIERDNNVIFIVLSDKVKIKFSSEFFFECHILKIHLQYKKYPLIQDYTFINDVSDHELNDAIVTLLKMALDILKCD